MGKESDIKIVSGESVYVPTGDKIIDLDEKMEIGKIRDINSYVLYSMIEKLGYEVVKRTIVKDNFDLLKTEVEKGLESSDIVILSEEVQ